MRGVRGGPIANERHPAGSSTAHSLPRPGTRRVTLSA
jgi:hypothetical protein